MTKTTPNTMQATILKYLMAFLVSTSLFGMSTTLQAQVSDESVSADMVLLFRSARAVISANQQLINDASKADKGLTGEVVIEMTKAAYKTTTGEEFVAADEDTLAGEAQAELFSAIDNIMNQAQPLINEAGRGFKGFLPAVFAGRVANSFSKEMYGKMVLRLTAPRSYVRNRKNNPDTWEDGVIENAFKSPSYVTGSPYSELTTYKGMSAYRYMIPEYYGESCLSCHGGPKGEEDITGGLKEGGVLGELGGAISLVLFKDQASTGED